ncbi:MAG: class I SAM-dependent methyltransferase [Nitrospirae bacterium]|nr:class I SAM-dependent methyltransferase [Nitrospirota bacterium]
MRTAVHNPGTTFAALDPCAGEGAALAGLTGGTRAITYGIELDQVRARRAGEKLQHVLHTSLFDTFIEPGSISLLLLNPPYDDAGGRRLEERFLRRAWPALKPEGVLVFIVPEILLRDYQVRVVLGCRFHSIKAYRFPEGEYERFRQIFVIGKLRADPDWHRREHDIPTEPFESLGKHLRVSGPWSIPYGKALSTFTCTEVSEDDVRAELETGTSARWLADKLRGTFAQMERPLMPLKKGHIVQLLLGGFLDNTVIELPGEKGPRRVAVKGFSQKHTHTFEDEEKGKTIIREYMQCGVNILDLATGQIEEMRF